MLRMRCVRPFPYECSPISRACALSRRDAASISEVDAVPLFTSSACKLTEFYCSWCRPAYARDKPSMSTHR